MAKVTGTQHVVPTPTTFVETAKEVKVSGIRPQPFIAPSPELKRYVEEMTGKTSELEIQAVAQGTLGVSRMMNSRDKTARTVDQHDVPRGFPRQHSTKMQFAAKITDEPSEGLGVSP